jgi:hypothetical protein
VVGNGGLISCHTTSQFGESYRNIKHGHMTLLKLPN